MAEPADRSGQNSLSQTGQYSLSQTGQYSLSRSGHPLSKKEHLCMNLGDATESRLGPESVRAPLGGSDMSTAGYSNSEVMRRRRRHRPPLVHGSHRWHGACKFFRRLPLTMEDNYDNNTGSPVPSITKHRLVVDEVELMTMNGTSVQRPPPRGRLPQSISR
ncbi:hypothetical protein FJT64_012206 [Amphibalanus amphitrite]|uniref:Uncharacterized protein n=1 Tax=Amphibalanus amphitrite TaxID=1232801 RepID=A0A6A4V8V5_AMPAM|nr:hypothetical protein FJT64_012206 [Amphibalanus amphitrite]